MGKIYDYEKESMAKSEKTSTKSSVSRPQNQKRETTTYIGGVNPEVQKNHNNIKKTSYNDQKTK